MNILPILVSAIACFIIGFLFHGPLFGKTWMRLAKVTMPENPNFKEMLAPMFWNFVTNIVCASVLSMMIWIAAYSAIMGPMTWYKGMIIGGWLWLGFTAMWTAMDVLWMKKSWKLWLFDSISFLVSIMAMCAILGAWR